MEQIKFGCYWQVKIRNAPGTKVGRIAHVCCLQMLPVHYYKGILYHILLINNEFPVLFRTMPSPILYINSHVCVCRLHFLCVLLLVHACVLWDCFPLSFASRFQSSELDPMFSLTLSLLPSRDRQTIVWFTIEFGKIPACDSHNLLIFILLSFELFETHNCKIFLSLFCLTPSTCAQWVRHIVNLHKSLYVSVIQLINVLYNELYILSFLTLHKDFNKCV